MPRDLLPVVLVTIVVPSIVFALSCRGPASGTSAPADRPAFLTQPEAEAGEMEAMEAMATGHLRLTGGCFRLEGDETHSLVWPAGYRLDERSEPIRVIDAQGRSVATPGDRLRLSGGEVPSADQLPTPMREEARRCPAPFWLVGAEVDRL